MDLLLLREQELAASEQGIADVVALLQQPEDLARLPALVRDHEAKARAARAAAAAAAQARVDALGLGMGLLGKSHRHIARLRGALARVDALCAECALLVGGDNHDAIRALSVAHANARRVLGELDDVVDLPARAEAVQRAFLPPAPEADDDEGDEEEGDRDADDDYYYGDSSAGGGGGGADFFGGRGGGGGGPGGGGGGRAGGRRAASSFSARDVGTRHAGELFRAFEGLTVIEGTANNSKEAWRRSAAARGGGGGGFGGASAGAGAGANPQRNNNNNNNSNNNPDGLRELNQYLSCVSKAMENFERRLWGRLRDFHELAARQPGLLVDAARVVKAQEAMDAHWAVVRAAYVRPKHWKERAFLEMDAAVSARFQPLLALARQHGRPNVPAAPPAGGSANPAAAAAAADGPPPASAPPPPPPLRWDERAWVDAVRALLLAREADLAHAFDRVAPCFPPDWRVFDHVFQCHHVQVATAVDLIGRRARRLSTAAQLALLEWVGGYQATLRGLGVEEGLVRLPVAPMLPPEPSDGLGEAEEEGEEEEQVAMGASGSAQLGRPRRLHHRDDDDAACRSGVALLIETYADRMEATVRGWVANILESDLESGPRPVGVVVGGGGGVGGGAGGGGGGGALRTPGAVEFFRILNEQVAVLEDVSRGELLHHVAQRSLAVMRAFVDAQRRVLPRAAAAPAGLELLCALLNNNLDCYGQSIGFTDHVKALLGQGEGGGHGGGNYQYQQGTGGGGGRRVTAGSVAGGGGGGGGNTTTGEHDPPPPLDVEDTCRAFLELAKSIGARVVDLIFSDDGMRDQTRRFFAPAAQGGAEWERGGATATALATLGDYFADVASYVDPSFSPRVIEGCLQELVRAYVAAAAERLPAATDARLARMACDERDVRVFFAGFEAGARPWRPLIVGPPRPAGGGAGAGGGIKGRRPARGRRRRSGAGWRGNGQGEGEDDDDDDEDDDDEDDNDDGQGDEDAEAARRRAALGAGPSAAAAAAAAASQHSRAWLPIAKVARHTAAIGALCGLYASPDAAGLARAYAAALDACPLSGLTPVVVERMLAARGDLPRQVQTEAAALCRETYAAWQKRERARGRAGNPLAAPTSSSAAPAAAAAASGGGGGGLARFFFLNQMKKQEQSHTGGAARSSAALLDDS